MPPDRTIPAAHLPFVRTALLVAFSLAAAFSAAVLQVVNDLGQPAAPSPVPPPEPTPGPLCTEGVPFSDILAGVSATQAEQLIGTPDAPSGAQIINAVQSYTEALVSELRRTWGVPVVGYPVPTGPYALPDEAPDALIVHILSLAYEAFQPNATPASFTAAQAQAFRQALADADAARQNPGEVS